MASVASIHRPAPAKPFSPPLFLSVATAGFPSPAEDHLERDLNLHGLLISHPAATYVRLSGDSMKNTGLYDGDMLVVDRSLEPAHGNIVVAVVNGKFTVKRLSRQGGQIQLPPENPLYSPILITTQESCGDRGTCDQSAVI